MDGAKKLSTEEEMEELEFTTATEITEEIFAENNAFYVEILEENYLYRRLWVSALANEKGNYLFANQMHYNRRYLKNGRKMKQRKKQVYDAKKSDRCIKRS